MLFRLFQPQKGDKGDNGSPGVGVPANGAANYVLSKKTVADYDTEWIAPSSGGGQLIADTTINFDNTMSADDIQTIMNNQPKNLGTKTLTFQFADGTYNLNNTLTFNYFYNGYLFIQGNNAESSTAHINQSVILNFNSPYYLSMQFLRSVSFLKKMKIITNIAGASYQPSIDIYSCIKLDCQTLFLRGLSSNDAAYGIRFSNGSFGRVWQTNIGDIYYGICADNYSILHSHTNYVSGTQPKIALFADEGGQITKQDAIQPTGSVSNETSSHGGNIR